MRLNISVPEHLSEITLEQYQKYAKVNNEENQNTAFLMHKMVEIFCNLNLKDVATIQYKYVLSIIAMLNELFEEKNTLIPTFNLNGIEYGFIPNLDEMSLGEYIDLDKNISEWATMHKAMAVLYRPITINKKERYQIEEYNGLDNSDIMKKMPLNVVMGSMVFFYNLNNELLKITLKYLERQTKTNLTSHQKAILQKNGVGISRYMGLLAEMLPNLKM